MNSPRRKKTSFVDQFDSMRGDYDMARQSRFIRRRTGVQSLGSGADYHFRNETQYYDSVEQARDMDRNDSLIGTLADRRVDNIVQGGFTLEPSTGDKKLDLDLWQWWEEFSNDSDACDVSGELTWKEIERHACRATSIDGDIVIVGTDEGSFQMIEGHLIRGKTKIENTFLGVETDQFQKRTRYHVLEELNQFGQTAQRQPIEVRDSQGVRQLFHVYDPKRVCQTRGVTQLANCFAISGMLEDINFAKLVQQQMVSMWAIIHKYPVRTDGGPPTTDGIGYTDSEIETMRNGTRRTEGITPGMEYFAEDGEDIQGFSPNIPNSEYFQQVRLIMQIMGVNFGLPLCLVLMDGSETNFSGWRGAVDEARKGFVADQHNVVRRLNKPAYVWKLNHRLQTDSLLRRAAENPKVKLFRHVWHPPTWSYIEPVADAEGDAMQLRNALTSPRRMHAARGKDWEEVSEEIVDDNMYAISNAAAKAAKFNKANPTSPPLTWRDLIPLPMPTGATIAMQDPTLVDAKIKADDLPEKPTARRKK